MLKRLLRGDVSARLQEASFIPFLSHLWRRIEALTDGVVAAPVRPSHGFDRPSHFHASSEGTWQMLFVRYGLTRVHLADYERRLAAITRLPAVLNFLPFQRAIRLDVLDDDSDY